MSVDDLRSLLADLTAERDILRSAAFHELVARVWSEDERVPGRGVAGKDAGKVVPDLIEVLGRRDAPSRHRVAFLLGLLAEAGHEPGADDGLAAPVRGVIRASVPLYLDLLDRGRHGPGESERALTRSLLYLLAHFGEDRTLITPRVAAALGADSEEHQIVSAILDRAESKPTRSKVLLMYLGAEACAAAGENLLERCVRTLACPRCRGRLLFRAADITCVACSRVYTYHGDVIDLVPAETADPDEFPEDAVKIYETQTRPAFVRVMANDWHGSVTAAREEAYLVRHLEPIEGPVLDLACGAGGWTTLVAKLVGAHRVIAIDYSYPMLAACQQVVPDALFVRGSASELPVADGVLGGANCSDALQALPDAEKALAEIARCLRPGAPLTCFTFRSAALPYRYFQHRFPPHPRRVFTEAQLLRYAERAGLEVTDMSGPNHAVFFAARKPLSAP